MWSCLTIHSVKIELIKTTVVYMPLENSDSVFLYRGPCFGLLLRESCSIAKIIVKPLNLLIKLPVYRQEHSSNCLRAESCERWDLCSIKQPNTFTDKGRFWNNSSIVRPINAIVFVFQLLTSPLNLKKRLFSCESKTVPFVWGKIWRGTNFSFVLINATFFRKR